MQIRPAVQRVIELFQVAPPAIPATEEQISVSAATKRLASAYERFRNILEPDEIDILRRKAIVRILLRRSASSSPTFNDESPQTISTALLQELIRASYIKHASHNQSLGLAHYIAAIRALETHLTPELFRWAVTIIAVAIDRILFPKLGDEALVHLMYHDTFQRSIWPDDVVAEADRAAQLFIGCHRALFASDESEIAYHYFVHHFPAWEKPENLTHVARELPRLHDRIKELIHHPSAHRITTLLRPIAAPYRILRQALHANPGQTIASAEALTETVQTAVQMRGEMSIRRIHTRARHSVFFLLLTKTILVLLIEIPYERFFLHQIHWGALTANTLFHPILLFGLSATVHLPGPENTEKIIEQTHAIITGETELPTTIISRSRAYGALTWTAFGIMYTVLFATIFWALAVALNRLGFSLLAMFLFVLFLGLVSFLAVRNRRTIDDIRVIPQHEGTISILISFIFLPILEFGGLLSRNLQRFNIPLLLMDRVLEAPFKLLIDLTEEWFIFVRERREEIV